MLAMQTAAEFTIPGLDDLYAYRVGMQAYLSKSQVVIATRGTDKDIKALDSFLQKFTGAADRSRANGSGEISDAFAGAAVDAVVPHQSGSKVAQLITPQIATQWFLKELSNRSEAVRKRAGERVAAFAAVGLDTLCREACGLTHSPAASLAAFFKAQATHEKADPINELKAELRKHGYRDNNRMMGMFINDMFYNRLPADVYAEMLSVRKEQRADHSFFGPTNWQVLSPDVQEVFRNTANMFKLLIAKETRERRAWTLSSLIKEIDSIQPRHRSSYVPL
jgi:hypothetical protein